MSRENVLVDAEWAEQKFNTSGVVFVEVDENAEQYDDGHLPGAISIHWRDELQAPVGRD